MASNKTSPDSGIVVAAKEADVERHAQDTSYLNNTVVKSLTWSGVTVTVKDHQSKKPKTLLGDVSGHVSAGELAHDSSLC